MDEPGWSLRDREGRIKEGRGKSLAYSDVYFDVA